MDGFLERKTQAAKDSYIRYKGRGLVSKTGVINAAPYSWDAINYLLILYAFFTIYIDKVDIASYILDRSDHASQR
jgi:hypothetical protein